MSIYVVDQIEQTILDCEAIAKKFEKMFGLICTEISCELDVMVEFVDTREQKTVTLPLWFVLRLIGGKNE